jgi:dihydroorotate dehydrogenase (NAD+) catalytic subunit
MTPDLKVKVGELEFPHPLMAASGTWSYGLEFLNHPVSQDLAAFVTKSLSLEPSQGNPMPRLYETDGGLLNSIGLQNIGIDAFLRDVEPQLLAKKSRYVLSLYANRLEDFERLMEKAAESSSLAIELNISCPNIDKGGLEFSSEAGTTETLVKRVKARIPNKPLWVKLSPNVTSIADIARAAEAGGADALSLINTLVGMAIDVEAARPWLAKKRGGLSGPALKPVALDRVFQVYQAVKIPLVGMGGIRTARDVIEFVMAGASAVQIGTWNFRDPFVYSRLLVDLKEWLGKRGFARLQDLKGRAHQKS